MKNIIKAMSLLLCAVMLISALCACGDAEKQTEKQSENGTEKQTEKQTEAQTEKQTEAQKIIKIACSGDSITYGVGASAKGTTDYPTLLGKKLGDGYEIGNFGLPGSTMIVNKRHPDANIPYPECDEYKASLEFCPDIVCLMLGTNDAGLYMYTGDRWNEQFVTDAKTIINGYKEVNPDVQIYIMTSPDLIHQNYAGNIHNALTGRVHVLQRQVAEELGCKIIDIYDVTKNQKSLYTEDGCHPNDSGYEVIASAVYEALTQK